jgi:hypothetical protein
VRDYSIRKDVIILEEAIKRTSNTHGENIILLEFMGTHGKSLFKCKICNNEWNADSWSVWNGNGCPNCSSRKLSERFRRNFKDVKNYIESQGCLLLSNTYINNRTNIQIQFPCGHISDMCFGSFKRGSRCKICGMKKFTISRKRSQENIIHIVEDEGFSFIEFPNNYVDRTSKIKYSCSLGHTNIVALREFLKTKKCYVCSKIDLIERISGANASNWQGGLTCLHDYILNKMNYWEKESIKQCNGKCVITGEKYDDIHHVYAFNLILRESINELNFILKENIGDYKKEDLKVIVNKVKEIHGRYPIGVCIKQKYHIKFHQMFGYGDTTPEMWYEFLDKVKSGEISI